MTLNILYQFNEKYAAYAGVSIFSLLENNRNAEQINIYIIEEKLSDPSRRKITEMIESYGRKVFWTKGEELIDVIKELGIPTYRGSYATNLKMFFPLYLENDVEKLLYIDSDTLVLDDLQPLFKLDLNGKPLGMALDSLAVRHKSYLGLSKNDSYYNAGIMLFDVASWKKHKCTKKIVDHAKNVRAHYMAPDQDLINVALHEMIEQIDIRYNLQPIHYRYSYRLYHRFWKQPDYYNRQETEAAVQKPAIVHFFRFLGEFPWHKDSRHPYADLYRSYLNKSPWREENPVSVPQNSFVFRTERWMYRHFPDLFFMFIFRACYDIFLARAEAASRKGKNYHQM